MLLSTPDQIKLYHSSGLWGDERLDQIFCQHVQDRPDELALIDDQDLHAVTGRRPQCLSFERAWRKVVALSNFLSGIGMKTDTVVAMLMPPSVDAAIFTLVASRMGLIIAPIPITYGETEIREKLERVGAKAILCTARYENEPVAERARNVAADMFSIRFVFCVGEGAPEGLIELQSVLDDEDSASQEDLFELSVSPSADAVLAIHWTSATSQPSRPIGRSHNQLLAVARHVHDQTDLESKDCLMVGHQLSGLNGFAGGLVGALDAGARIQFHHFQTLAHYAEALSEYGGEHVFLPGAHWQAFHSCLSMSAREQLKSVTLIWNRSHAAKSDFCENETAARLLDLTNFGELALFCQIRRHPGEIGSVPLGEINGRKSLQSVWLETNLYGVEEARARSENKIVGGELCLKGAMIPLTIFPVAGAIKGDALRSTSDGFIHTEIGCHLVTEEHGEQRALFRPLGDLSDVLSFGGLSERGVDLDLLYKECGGVVDAAAFVVPSEDDGPGHLMVALVVEDEAEATEHFYTFLKDKQISSTKWPRDVLLVQAIPRQTDGRVQRDSLLAASQLSQVA
ncbi:AMP-binding protein [Cohaesibacter celericrescens]|uniref:AMP-binding protein n=1 Tax=Cohaesibacter celericrescens TaxID=2067669 RepID=UPI003564937C